MKTLPNEKSFSSGRRIIDKVKISDGPKGEFTLKETETDTETQSDKMATVHNGIVVSVQYEQECIPVGCVPSATVAISTGRGVSASGSRGMSTSGSRCENISLPQTSFAGSNNSIQLHVSHFYRYRSLSV